LVDHRYCWGVTDHLYGYGVAVRVMSRSLSADDVAVAVRPMVITVAAVA
jgi:hypothetical protein